MSKYPFFGKRGRPSKEEIGICKKINGLIDAEVVSQEDVDAALETEGVPTDKKDLEMFYTYLSGESSDGEKGSLDSSSQVNNDTSKEGTVSNDNTDDFSDDISDEFDSDANFSHADGEETSQQEPKGMGADAVDFDPFNENVVEREYTKRGFGTNDDILDEEDFENPHDNSESVADEVGSGAGDSAHEEDIPNQKFEEEIPEPDYVKQPYEDAEFEEEQEDGDEGQDSNFDEDDEKLGGDNLEDLSPAQKRKAAEKTADALLDMYGNFAPLPFKKWASISESKVQKMAFNNQLDTEMPVENGVTVQDYIDGVNEQVEEVFTVDDDTKDSIRDPLIDVLLEQEVALTPTQRLLMAVGSHVATMGISAYKLSQNNKQALDTFKQFHAERTGGNKNTNQSTNHSSTVNNQQSKPQYSEDAIQDHEKEAVKDMMDELEKEGDDIVDPEHDSSVTVEETNED